MYVYLNWASNVNGAVKRWYRFFVCIFDDIDTCIYMYMWLLVELVLYGLVWRFYLLAINI